MTQRQVRQLKPHMQRLFEYLEARGNVFLGPDEVVVLLRFPTLDELGAAVNAAGLPPPNGGIERLREVLFGEPVSPAGAA